MIVESPLNRTIQEDMEQLVQAFPQTDLLQGKTVLVTGATGLIGSQIVKTLACFNRLKETDIQIIAHVRNAKKAEDLFGHLMERGDVTLSVGDITEKIQTEKPVDYIIHGASATSSRYFVSNPVETIQIALNGTTNVLEFARSQEHLQGMVYMSSLEVYGTPATTDFIKESDYGYIDPLSVRSSYSEGKRMAECICASYAGEYQVPVRIARLSQTFGPGVDYNDGRVFAEFMRCALEHRDIVLHTEGKTVRTYCYIKDAISAILHVLLFGTTGKAYNVTNKNTAVSIREMGELVAETLSDGDVKVVVDIPEDLASFGYNPEMIIRLDSSELEALGWQATVDLKEMYLRMAESFQE